MTILDDIEFRVLCRYPTTIRSYSLTPGPTCPEDERIYEEMALKEQYDKLLRERDHKIAELMETCRELCQKIQALQGRVRPTGGAGVFRKRYSVNPEYAGVPEFSIDRLSVFDEITLELTDAGRMLSGSGTWNVRLTRFHHWPTEVVAENWWHLCSIIGAAEVEARIFYDHPEADQPSAVAQMKGVDE